MGVQMSWDPVNAIKHGPTVGDWAFRLCFSFLNHHWGAFLHSSFVWNNGKFIARHLSAVKRREEHPSNGHKVTRSRSQGRIYRWARGDNCHPGVEPCPSTPTFMSLTLFTYRGFSHQNLFCVHNAITTPPPEMQSQIMTVSRCFTDWCRHWINKNHFMSVKLLFLPHFILLAEEISHFCNRLLNINWFFAKLSVMWWHNIG